MKTILKGKISFQFFGFIGIIAAFPFLFSGSACNRTNSHETKNIANQLNDSKFQKTIDKKNAAFLVAASELYLREIKLAQLAQQKAAQADVRELGRMNEEFNTHQFLSVVKLAKSKSISIPTSPNSIDEEIFTSISCKSKYDFDKAYCDETISSQNRSLKFFEKAIAETTQDDIKNWASVSLPKMKKQLSYALMCQKNIIRWQRYKSLML